MEELKGKIATHESQLQQDIRSINNLKTMIPYKIATRDCIIQTTININKRIKSTFLELSKLLCYHDILEKDLCATMKEDADGWVRDRNLIRRATHSVRSNTCRNNKLDLLKFNSFRDTYPRSASTTNLPTLHNHESSKSVETHQMSAAFKTASMIYQCGHNSSPTLPTRRRNENSSSASEEINYKDKEESGGEYGEGSEEFLSAEEY
jgi:hypothetical protein